MSNSNASDAFAKALRLLSRADRSEVELRRKLGQSDFPPSAIDDAVNKCREYNYLNNQRYAKERARALARSGRGVGPRIRADLLRRGLEEKEIQRALTAAEEEFPREKILREQLERKFPRFIYSEADDRQRRRVVAYFQRRGFCLEDIFSILRG